MFVKALGILDIICAIFVLFYFIGLFPYYLVLCAAIYLILKCIIFFGDFLSIIDGIMGILMLIILVAKLGILCYIIILYLLFKGFVSMLEMY
jgi:hypothetical protein